MKILYSFFIGMLMAAMVVTPALAAPYVAPKVFSYRDPILSHDMNDINTAISDACGTGKVTSAQLATGAAIANVGAGGISALYLDYSDSFYWDTMPVKMYATTLTYTGDSTCTGSNRVSCGGLRPVRVEIVSMVVGNIYRFTQDVSWDTTAALYEYGDTMTWSDTTASGNGCVRITKGDTQFVVYNVTAGVRTPNVNGVKYNVRVWGF